MRTGLAIPASLSSITPLSLNRIDAVHNDYTQLLGQFPELTRPTTKGETVKHGITHKIVTKGHSVFARPRRLAPDKLVTAKREFDDMINVKREDNNQPSFGLGFIPTCFAYSFIRAIGRYQHDKLVLSSLRHCDITNVARQPINSRLITVK